MPSRNELLPVPLPRLGLNTIIPFSDWESGYAREFSNMALYRGRVKMRPAVEQHVYNGVTSDDVHWIDVASAEAGDGWVILRDGNIRKISDSSGAASIGGTCDYHATTVKHKDVELVVGCQAPRIITNPFTAFSFTPDTVTATEIRAAASHRGRLYFADQYSVDYSEVGAGSGATMAGNFSFQTYLDGQSISRIFSVTISPTDDTQNVFVVFGDEGKVLVWQGSFPGSTAWHLKASFDMPKPGSNQCFLEIDGDIWVATTRYAYWFRDLFQGGAQTAYENSPSLPVEDIWQGVTWTGTITTQAIGHVFYDPVLDAIVSSCSDRTAGPTDFNQIFNTQHDQLSFVYHRKYKAWAVWGFTYPFYAPVLESATEVLYGSGTQREIMKLNEDSIEDTYIDNATGESSAVVGTWKTPYVTPGYLIKLNGCRVFFENTDSGYFEKVRSIFDYSDYNTPLGWDPQPGSDGDGTVPGNKNDSSIDTEALDSGQYNDMAGCGGMGGSLSMQFTLKAREGGIKTQSGQITFGASEDTATATLATAIDTTKAFVMIDNVAKVAIRDTVDSGGADNRDVGAYLEIVDSTTIRATRDSGGEAADYVVNYTVVEFVGSPGDANEFKVLARPLVSMGGTDTTASVAISGHTDINDVVPFCAGVVNSDNNENTSTLLTRISIDTTDAEVDLERDSVSNSATNTVALALVELIGSNWSVQQVTHTYVADNTDETESLSPTVTWANSFIVSTLQSGGSKPGDCGHVVRPGTDGTTVRFFLPTSTLGVTDRITTAFVISNSDVNVTHDDSVTGSATALPALTTTVNNTIDLDTIQRFAVMASMCIAVTGAANDNEAFWNYRLTTITNLEMEACNQFSSGTAPWAYQLIEFPGLSSARVQNIYAATCHYEQGGEMF